MAQVNVRNRKKADGTNNWEYRFEAAKVDGKRKHISKGGFKTKKEALEAGNKALAEYNNAGLKFEPTEISVSDFLDYWLNNYCKMNVADSTYNIYKRIINNHVRSRIGFYKLKSVSTLILQEMVNEIYVQNNLSETYMKNIMKVIKGSFKYATKVAKLIKYDPAEDVSLPVMRPESAPKDIIILSKDDIRSILSRFEDKSPCIYYSILTAYYTGFRVSEVFGLTWDCVDFENKTITINKAAKKIEKDGKTSERGKKRGIRGKATTKWYFGACKNSSSYRTIDVGDTLLDALKQYKEWQEANEEEYGELYTRQYLKDEISQTNRKVQRLIPLQDLDIEIPYERTYPVFIKENGTFQGSDAIKYASKVINYELGIEFNFHALRHTHATMLIEANLPIKAISERLGHSNTRTTLETYVHVTENMRINVVDSFEQFGSLKNDSKVITIGEIKRKVDSIAK